MAVVSSQGDGNSEEHSAKQGDGLRPGDAIPQGAKEPINVAEKDARQSPKEQENPLTLLRKTPPPPQEREYRITRRGKWLVQNHMNLPIGFRGQAAE